jgi:hypothetical protein
MSELRAYCAKCRSGWEIRLSHIGASCSGTYDFQTTVYTDLQIRRDKDIDRYHPNIGTRRVRRLHCAQIYLALPAPAGGGARPILPFLERPDEVPAVVGKVDVERGRVCSGGRDGARSSGGALMGAFCLAGLEGSASTCMSSSVIAESLVAARLLGRCATKVE